VFDVSHLTVNEVTVEKGVRIMLPSAASGRPCYRERRARIVGLG
jgi:hypothetical protein